MSELEVAARVASRGVDVELRVPDGQVLALLGPNGAGKSTVIEVVAGLVRPTSGRVVLGGSVLTDVAGSVVRPAHRREIALLAQEALLFPHLSVLDNVAFPLRSSGVRRGAAHERAREWLDRVGAVELSSRRPRELSGGQAQRVAVARALAAEPRILLLDEPFAALDVSVARHLRTLVRRVLREHNRTAIVVTHDVVDALTLADQVVVLEGGRIAESGSVREVLATPRSVFAARIAGLNLFLGTATDDGLLGPPSLVGKVDPECVAGEHAAAVFAPTAVAVHLERPHASPRNVFAAVVTEVESRGGVIRVHADTTSEAAPLIADITVAAAAELRLEPGSAVYFAVKATEVSVYPR